MNYYYMNMTFLITWMKLFLSLLSISFNILNNVELESYPEFFFYSFGIIGFIFLITKPQYTFWMGIFYFSAREGGRAALTRTPLFGPYLNLDDFIILLMLLSLIHLSFSHKIKMPSIVYWIALCVFASILIMAAKYSLTYPVQREHKWVLYFPLAMFLSYNFVLKEKDLERSLKFCLSDLSWPAFNIFLLLRKKYKCGVLSITRNLSDRLLL